MLISKLPNPTSPSTQASVPAAAKKVCDVLLSAGLLKPEQFEAVLAHMQRTGERAEESILELGFVPEVEMLKALATFHKTYFISTEKLSKAELSPAVFDMIPQRFAENVGMCPILFDAKTHALSVVTADPDNTNALGEVQLASGARDVKPILARPAAVRAAIAKGYTGDIHAFALLDRAAHAQFQAMLNVYERNLVSDDSMATALAKSETSARGRERVLSEKELSRAAKAAATHGGSGTGSTSFLELLNVMISLLENARADLRGHSSHVARLTRRVAERMSLDDASTTALVTAAYVHDLGKMGQFHLTTFNASEYDGHKVAAQKTYGTPSRLLEPVRLSQETIEGLDHMYERYDGKGFPAATAGKEIPLASRILAITDTYADLTQNARNPFRKMLSANDACNVLAKYKDTIFDPHLVDLFRHLVMGEDLKARLLANRYQALIVDTDPEETTVIELRMIEQGFVVKTARSPEQALKTLAEGETDLVVSELDLAPSDGLALLAEARKLSWGANLPWVIYTRRQEKAKAQKAFELGVLDYVAKPAATDVLVAKLKAMLDQRATPKVSGGVSGSLKEMSLPDLVQVLFHGRKTGNLRIRAREGQGEIHVLEGAVVNALWGEQRGVDAFYAMLRIQDGEFGLDPSFKPTAKVIQQSSEALLLEGMRRLDEGIT
jgi:response regulator RpfG family c-di-GMP phosphodiesterase